VTYRILVLDTISPAGLERFPKDRYAVGPDLERPDAVLVRSRDLHSMEIGESVKAVGRAGIGVDNIPVEALTAASWCSTPLAPTPTQEGAGVASPSGGVQSPRPGISFGAWRGIPLPSPRRWSRARSSSSASS
jgi:hypothetical protein